MIWTDILVEQILSDEEICFILHKILNTPLNKIQVIGDIKEILFVKNKDVICRKVIFQGGFEMFLDISILKEEEETVLPSREKFTESFSVLSKSKCLLPTESDISNEMYLFDGYSKKIVYFDEDRYEKEGKYYLKKLSPT